VERVIERMPGVWGRIAELILLTGLRWGEAVAVEPGDIDGAILRVRRTRTRTGAANPPKTRAGVRAVPLSPRAQELLAELPLPVGGDYRRALEALVHAMGDLHRPGMGWHTIRAAHATLLDVTGHSLREAAARMGHGHHYAQTLAYQVTAQAGDAEALDRFRGDASPSAGRGRVVRLPASRARRLRTRGG
jgi:integrase